MRRWWTAVLVAFVVTAGVVLAAAPAAQATTVIRGTCYGHLGYYSAARDVICVNSRATGTLYRDVWRHESFHAVMRQRFTAAERRWIMSAFPWASRATPGFEREECAADALVRILYGPYSYRAYGCPYSHALGQRAYFWYLIGLYHR